MYLLDTNIVSELRRRKPHGAVLAWLQSVDNRDLHIAAATVGELQTGIERARETDPLKAAELEAWLDALLATHTVLPMGSAAFRLHARLTHRVSRTLHPDAMIAATAAVHALTVVTRNIGDFVLFGVPLLNPFVSTQP